MTDPTSGLAEPRKGKTGKMMVQMLVGAVAGAAAMAGALMAAEGSALNLDSPSRVAALTLGVVFSLLGLSVGLGVLMPKAGAHLLNVEDAEELREQRRPLWWASMGCALIGVLMLVLATADTDGSGLIPRNTAGAVALGCTALMIAVSVFAYSRYDELMRATSMEASALSMYLTLLVGGGWAGLAHFGYVRWIDPLGLLALLLGLQLLGSFWAVGRRGMLRPR